MTTLQIDKQTFTCSLRYSPRRRTIQIRVPKSDCLEIAAPAGMAWEKIQKLIESKHPWILRQLKRLNAVAADPANASLTHGSTVLYQGAPHTLLLLADGQGKPTVTYSPCAISLHLTELIGQDNDPVVYQSLKRWYAEQSQEMLLERTRYWAAQMGVQPGRISLRDQKTRWGSCSSRGSINYNWRIIMAPPAVLDYLVIHELSHMLHPNHSPAFWKEVSHWCSDFRMQRRWLRQNGGMLAKLLPS